MGYGKKLNTSMISAFLTRQWAVQRHDVNSADEGSHSEHKLPQP
jgi:hypothetical protein